MNNAHSPCKPAESMPFKDEGWMNEWRGKKKLQMLENMKKIARLWDLEKTHLLRNVWDNWQSIGMGLQVSIVPFWAGET